MKNFIKKLIPYRVKKDLRSNYYQEFKQKHASRMDTFNGKAALVELEEKHLINLRAVPHRIDILKRLPPSAVIAELGVDEGNFSEEILKHAQPSKLHLVDVWENERYNQNKRKGVETKLASQLKDKTVEINIGYSTEVATTFKDHYFDFVYIDTVHDYRVTSEELKAYANKVKPGGLMGGHDYIEGNWRGLVKYGVIDAVHEFCVKEGWEFVYLTMETREHRSFAIRKLNL